MTTRWVFGAGLGAAAVATALTVWGIWTGSLAHQEVGGGLAALALVTMLATLPEPPQATASAAAPGPLLQEPTDLNGQPIDVVEDDLMRAAAGLGWPLPSRSEALSPSIRTIDRSP